MCDDTDTILAGDVLREEHRLALDGYHITVMPAELNTTLAKITLMSGQETYEQATIWLDAACPTRDEAVLEAMIGYLNSGGDPAHLSELAERLRVLPRIVPNQYKLLGTYGHVAWVSYYRHQDGRLFEVHHGSMAEEITQEELDDLMEAGPLQPMGRVLEASGQEPTGRREPSPQIRKAIGYAGADSAETGGQGEERQGGAEDST